MIRSIADEMLCSSGRQPPGTGSAAGKVREAPIWCWGTQIWSQQPGSCAGGSAHLSQAGIIISFKRETHAKSAEINAREEIGFFALNKKALELLP